MAFGVLKNVNSNLFLKGIQATKKRLKLRSTKGELKNDLNSVVLYKVFTLNWSHIVLKIAKLRQR